MGEEIDLTAYLDMLLRRWKLVIGIALVVTILAVGIVALLPPAFRARALVATTREKTRVSLGTSIQTLSEDDLDPEIDRTRRLTTFVAMVPNPLIAQQVLDEIGSLLPEDVQSVSVLLGMVEGSIVKDSDAIAIDVTHSDPQVAALLANAWARAHVGHVNRTYSGDAGEAFGIVRAEAESARAVYGEAQSALADLLRDERFDVLGRRLAEVQALLQGLSDARAGAGRMSLARLDRVDRLLASARDMRDQVAAGGEPAAQSDALAFALLQVEAFGALAGQPQDQTPALFHAPRQHPLDPPARWETSGMVGANRADGGNADIHLALDVPVGQVSAAEMLADLDALIATFEARRATLSGELLGLAQSVNSDQDWAMAGMLPSAEAPHPQVGDTLTELSSAQSQLEQLARDLRIQLISEEDRLVQGQDRVGLARETLKNLARKEAELALSALTPGAEARVAMPATIPTGAINSPLSVGVIAAAAGLVLGILAAYSMEFWRGYRARTRFTPDAASQT